MDEKSDDWGALENFVKIDCASTSSGETCYGSDEFFGSRSKTKFKTLFSFHQPAAYKSQPGFLKNLLLCCGFAFGFFRMKPLA